MKSTAYDRKKKTPGKHFNFIKQKILSFVFKLVLILWHQQQNAFIILRYNIVKSTIFNFTTLIFSYFIFFIINISLSRVQCVGQTSYFLDSYDSGRLRPYLISGIVINFSQCCQFHQQMTCSIIKLYYITKSDVIHLFNTFILLLFLLLLFYKLTVFHLLIFSQ